MSSLHLTRLLKRSAIPPCNHKAYARRLLMFSVFGLLACALTGCALPGSNNQTAEAILREMKQSVQVDAGQGNPDAINNALMPPLAVSLPKVENQPLETRFDLAINDTPASQVFMAIVSGTRYSMLLHPEISGNISLNLKDVTVLDALEAIRETYGYDYRMDGTRIYIQPLTLQTRIFQVNYLTGTRTGTSSLSVSSSSASNNAAGVGGAAATGTAGTQAGGTTGGTTASSDGSKVMTSSSADFWEEFSRSLKAIVGNEKGRSVVISPMSGVIVVRAMPDELRNIAAFLKASQISIERQVILEAKIVEVRLNDNFQSGVNWAAFRNPALGNIANSKLSAGQVSAGAALPQTFAGLGAAAGTTAALTANVTGSLFGLAFQTNNFAALLSFLETQGNVHVLSSPRIATLNNQKAVLKVGTDEYFVTNVSSNTTSTGTAGSTNNSSVTLQPFFSGIALDVTPRIDQNNDIILHIHPSVSSVSTVNKMVNTGTGGTLNLPLASSSISETDSIVRARDGQIVAIGGLMRLATIDAQSGLPGMPKIIFGQTNRRFEKHELVILLKPTVVGNDKDWSDDIRRSSDRFNGMVGQGASR